LFECFPFRRINHMGHHRDEDEPLRPRIPPPVPPWHYGSEHGFWGLPILAECEEPVGLALWRAARAARLFVEIDQKSRKRLSSAKEQTLRQLFVPDDSGHEWVAPLAVFPQVLGCDPNIDASELARACAELSRIAGESWYPQTELHFAELSARAEPENPTRANDAGRACRTAGLIDRAAVWFERAFRQSVQQKNRSEAVRALLAQGTAMKDAGRLADARRWFLKAARRAARTGRRKRAAEARHDLMALSAEMGDYLECLEHARAATDLYPLRARRLPFLAHDFAFALLRQQQYALAFPLLQEFIRVVPRRFLLPGLATFAWAAAGRGAVHRHAEAERRAMDLLDHDYQQAAPSLILLAEAARTLHHWERAERHLHDALQAAERTQQRRYKQDALALLDNVRAKRITPPASLPPEELTAAQYVVRQLGVRVKHWKPRSGLPADDAQSAAGNG